MSSFLGPSATQTSSTTEQDSTCSNQAQQCQQPQPQQKELPEIYRPHFTPIEYHLFKPVKVKCNHCPKEYSLGSKTNPTYGNPTRHLMNAHKIPLKRGHDE